MLVGEIGIERNTFLYELREWEIIAVIKGYRRRNREQWEMHRHVGMTICCALGAKLSSANEYLPLPWDNDNATKISEEEARELVELMQRESENESGTN